MHSTIIGIDTGFATTGWAIARKNHEFKNNIELVDFGCVETSKTRSDSLRLLDLYKELGEIIEKYKPDIMAIESLFFFKNQKTVIKVAQARGVILLAASNSNLPVYDYTPLQVKTSVTGYGRAEKSQVQRMVQMIYGLKELPKPDDAADAIAVATCHINTF